MSLIDRLSHEVFERLLPAAESSALHRLLLLLAYHRGLRWSEVRTITSANLAADGKEARP